MQFGRNQARFKALHAVSAVVFALMAAGAHAQDTTTTTVRHGESSYETKVKNAQVVYVEGNDLVLKLENGKVEHMVVPASEKFTIDGRDLTVSQLKTGTKLTQTVTTTTTPRYVNSVRVIKGKVWHVNAPGSVILTMPEGNNQVFNMPNDAKFTVGGKPATAFDLRKGMKIEATVVTDEPQTLVASNKATVGQAPALSTPPMVGLLLFPRYEPVVAQEASNVTAEHVDPLPASLPDTGSELPLIGLLGALGVASSFGLYLTRKRAAIGA